MSSVKLTTTGGNGGTVELKGPANTTSNAAVQLTLPVDDGTANQYLKTDGSGALSWATVSAGVDGISSSADATAMTIDSSERVMLGTTTEGHGNADEFTVSYNNSGVSGSDQGRCGITIRSGANTSSVNQPGYIYFSDGTSGSNEYAGYVTYTHQYNALWFGTAGATRFELHDDGNVKINDGNLEIGTGGHGIDFSTQTASSATGASATAELLDHYEEGTWTPDPYTGTASHAHSYYVRVGTKVTVWTELSSFSDTSTQSIVQIQGLPFASDGNVITLVGHCVTSNSADGDSSNSLIFNSFSMLTVYGGSSGAFNELNYANLDSNSVMYITATYFAN